MVKPVAARGLHNLVVQQLGRLIVSGELAPGSGLPREEVLAERLQVSRTALREAMKVLVAKGLIESRQRTGARVRDEVNWNQLDADVLGWRCASMPTDSFVEKLVEMRELIEPGAAAAAAKRRTEAQLADLKAAYEAMAASADLDAWAEADLAFHQALLKATNNELMVSLFSVIETALGTFFLLSARNAGNFKAALPYHQEVYEAVRRKRPEVARKAMASMVAESRENMGKRPRKRRASAEA
ncbi:MULTISPECIES: FadR/GntR family transcriptional regulator [unclassified Luteibacter]|uniref:FadR/GntR family transcriptional regulator n=1 Tax=unclassified Luteibacter TaxID=2620188 RepID=UPI0008C47037|nr:MULTISPECIES: FadR/GntR family transcriptional regulator [unclassified Luteibacter]MDR6935082.1 DNA-binding FadR family transcriptional regulator [Luteibacter sp. 3190]SEO80908.1 DNA-binding transcriptional regulator, FadR family [Luteibacter sp. UNC138MFCol5.1]SEV99534.1 DNA-binding transcriptional regulator, FadR family [Luteibacter sp. 329MFSha]